MASYRNNIVTKLMDRTPARYKEGFIPKADDSLPYVIFEMADRMDVIIEFFRDNHFYSTLSHNHRTSNMQMFLDNLHEARDHASRSTWLGKLQMYQTGPNNFHTMLANLVTREAISYTVVQNREINPNFNRFSTSGALQLDNVLQRFDTLGTYVCAVPAGFDVRLYDHDVHGLQFIRRSK